MFRSICFSIIINCILLFPISAHSQAIDCSMPLAIKPIESMRIHLEFPINYRAEVNRSCNAVYTWRVESGPPEFNIDGAGGLFYWTPKELGLETITISVEENKNGVVQKAYATFNAVVDDYTITYPLWRDYRTETENIEIAGRTNGSDFVSYSLYYAQKDPQPNWKKIAGPITTPVKETGPLATWNISNLPDGGNYFVKLVVDLQDGSTSELQNEVIIDRTLRQGWTKRIGPISHSITVADVTGDTISEVIAVTHFGELYVWTLEGSELWHTDNFGSTYSGSSVGDINGDGHPEIVWATIYKLYAYQADGSLVLGFPIDAEKGQEFRSTPTLADLDNDGTLDVVVATQPKYGASQSGTVGKVYAYRNSPATGQFSLINNWPQPGCKEGFAASPAIGDVDGNGTLEVAAECYDRAYLWRSDGSSYPGWENGVVLVSKIDQAVTNGAGAYYSTSQVALGDLNLDGKREIIIGSNVITLAGTPFPGFESPKSGVLNSLSTAVANVDQNLKNGLEIVIGSYAFYANGESMPYFPITQSMSSAIAVDCGDYEQLSIVAGTRLSLNTPGVLGYHSEYADYQLNQYPKKLYGETGDAGAPQFGDFDRNGVADVGVTITDGSYGGIVAIYNMPVPFRPERSDWPMMGHNIYRTGYYGCVLPSVAVSSDACICGFPDKDSDGDGIFNCAVVKKIENGGETGEGGGGIAEDPPIIVKLLQAKSLLATASQKFPNGSKRSAQLRKRQILQAQKSLKSILREMKKSLHTNDSVDGYSNINAKNIRKVLGYINTASSLRVVIGKRNQAWKGVRTLIERMLAKFS